MKQTERKKLKKKLDTLWSKLVKDKANNTCERCFSQAKRLNSHHLVSRRYIQTRYNLSNGISLCVGCHFYAHQNSLEFSKWVIEKKGEDWYNRLQLKKQALTKVDLKMVEIVLNEEKTIVPSGHTGLFASHQQAGGRL